MMPSPFDVTVVPTGLKLNPAQVGELEVSVRNRGGRSLTPRALRVADPKAALDWLQPRDQEETPLGDGETRKFRFSVKVPANAAAQTVKLRVDVADVTDPDQYFTQGPTIAVVVQQAAAPVKQKKPWWPYAVAAAVVLLVAGGIYMIVRPKQAGGVPNLVGLDAASAEAALSRAKLKPKRADTLFADTVKFRAGIVVAQSPDSGKAPPPGDTVAFQVQRAWAVVPPVLNIPYQQASDIIALQGLMAKTPVFVATNNTALVGMVQNVTPGPRTLVGKGDSVTVTAWVMSTPCQPWPRCVYSRSDVKVYLGITAASNQKASRAQAAARPGP